MSVTININNLSLSHKSDGGTTRATLPDVCKTPAPGGPVPVPFPNIAFAQDLMKGTSTIKADGGNMCSKYGSEFFKSTGDEAGTVGGVVSNTFIKEASWMTFSFDVKLEGKGACRLTDKMFHNHLNTVNMSGKEHNPVVTEHECLLWESNWIEGPLDVFEELEISPPLGPEVKYGTLYECWSVSFKVKFQGKVECKCTECGAVKIHDFQSPTYEGNYSYCTPWQPSLSDLIPGLGGRSRAAMSILKNLWRLKKAAEYGSKAYLFKKLFEEFGDTILKSISLGAITGKGLLKGSAMAICSGSFDVDELKRKIENLPRPLPPYDPKTMA